MTRCVFGFDPLQLLAILARPCTGRGSIGRPNVMLLFVHRLPLQMAADPRTGSCGLGAVSATIALATPRASTVRSHITGVTPVITITS